MYANLHIKSLAERAVDLFRKGEHVVLCRQDGRPYIANWRHEPPLTEQADIVPAQLARRLNAQLTARASAVIKKLVKAAGAEK